MIQEDGSRYQCFNNAMAAGDSKFSVWDDAPALHPIWWPAAAAALALGAHEVPPDIHGAGDQVLIPANGERLADPAAGGRWRASTM